MTWEPIDTDAGLWRAEKRTKQGWSIRSTAVRMADGRLLVVSPIRGLGDAAHDELRAIGEPAALLAPNFFHNLGLREYAERYPDAVVVASDVAAPRVHKKTRLAIESLDALRGRLPGHVSILEPDGTKNGEVWLRVDTGAGVAWCVADALFNVPASPTGLIGLFLRRTKTVPGLCIGWTFLSWGLRDRAAYRTWFERRLDLDRPTRLIVAHGEDAAGDDLPDRIAELAARRL